MNTQQTSPLGLGPGGIVSRARASLRLTTPLRATVLVAAAAVLVHARAAANGLALDDVVILAHPLIQSWATLTRSLASPWWYSTNHLYRPLTLLTFGLERALVGSQPWIPHVVNIGLHGVATVLLTRLLMRFTSFTAAVVAGVAFATWPVHAEAVDSVVGRAELLCGIALLCLMHLAAGEKPPSTRARVAAVFLAAAALASKETGVVAPLMVFAIAWARPAQRRFAFVWMLSAAAGTLVILTARLAVLGTFGGDSANPVFRTATTGHRIAIALTMIPRMAAMLLLPIRPAIDFVPSAEQINHPPLIGVLLGTALLLLAGVAALVHLRRSSVGTLGMWIVAATVAPTANILFPSGVVLAGRTLYVASIGAAFLLAWVLTSPIARGAPVLVAGGAIICALVGATLSWQETVVWRSNDSVITTMMERHPDDYRSYLHLAYIMRDQGRQEESLIRFRQATARFSCDSEMLTDAATVALRVRDTSTARAWLERAIEVNPRASRARTRLVGVLRVQGDTARARQLLIDGVSLEPDQREWRRMLGPE
jgi:protein O-mannosyl-transferase